MTDVGRAGAHEKRRSKVLRSGGAVVAIEVVAIEVVAVLVAYLAFGPATLLVSAPLVVGTILVLLAVRLSERPRRLLRERRTGGVDPAGQPTEGLLGVFFEIPAQAGPAALPESSRYGPAHDPLGGGR
jgi:hypothetical protein